MPEIDERPDAVKLAERCTSGLEERLGRDHQDAHGFVIFSRALASGPHSCTCGGQRFSTSGAKNRSTLGVLLLRMSADQSSRSSKRSYALMALKFAVSAVLLALLFSQVDTGRLWSIARRASVPWLVVALGVYFVNILASTWRWRLLLDAQDVHVKAKSLLESYLVAQFFNNFLPSNIGGDVIRIRDTAKPARSKTLATMVVLVDRGLGLMGLVLVAALSATIASRHRDAATPIWPSWLWTGFLAALAASVPAVLTPSGFGRLLRPLTVFHPEWVGERIDKLTGTLSRFRDRPSALVGCFGGAIVVQLSIVAFYFTVTYALHMDVKFSDLAE